MAEKPSVAMSIASVLGVKEKKDGFVEGEDYIVSWCCGHLVGLASADCYDSRYSKWVKEDLPILPELWQFTVPESAMKQFTIIKNLMERSDVKELIEATDAGREGELIFRLVYNKAGCKKNFYRLWISSMEESAIRNGFGELRPGKDYDNLYEAALCRAKADWLVGINGTRLFSTLYNGRTINIGRVMTPTLAILAEREELISGFKKEKFYTVEIDCGNFNAASLRFDSRTEAEKLRQHCLGKRAKIEAVTRKEKTEKPPKLYDLTSLQREANRIFGYTAQQTLNYIQLLYEKKLATYPRTDSQYLTEDMEEGISELCNIVCKALNFKSVFSGKVNAAQVINNAKVSDHHAIIPTAGVQDTDLSSLPTGERNILTMVSVRLLCAVSPCMHIYSDTEAVLQCAESKFTVKSRIKLEEGWKELENIFMELSGRKQREKQDAVQLDNLMEGQVVIVKDALLKEGVTSSPKRYTEASLLSAMENAGAEQFAQLPGAERKGLGTPATRAGVIEKLIKGRFAERKGRQIIPTKRGMELIKILPDTVKSAKLTAEWESALKRVESGELLSWEFLTGIKEMLQKLVKSYENVNISTDNPLAQGRYESLGKCPRCGKPVFEGKKSFYCSGYKTEPPCGFVLWKDNFYFKSKRKDLTKKVAEALLKDGKVKMKGLYSEKKGVLYDAVIVMEDTGEKNVKFKLEFPQKKKS